MADELDLARSVVKLRTALERYMVGMEQRAMQDPDPIALVHTADVAKDIRLILGGFEPGLMWPRTWSLPPEPGPEVTGVRCKCHGIRWDRTDLITAARETLWQAEHHEPGFGWPTWRDLLANHDKLTDATETGADQ